MALRYDWQICQPGSQLSANIRAHSPEGQLWRLPAAVTKTGLPLDGLDQATTDRSRMNAIQLAEQRWLPDWLIRVGIRRMLADRIRQQQRDSDESQAAAVASFADSLRASPIAIDTESANDQHYEVPAEFFQTILGPRLKYSCGLWDTCQLNRPETKSKLLAESEDAMLALTCQRANIVDGMRVLDLGCGWGSFTLYAAEQFPGCEILAVSNSNSQREWIQKQAAERGLQNVEVRTADARDFEAPGRFDRVVSIEMFEHMRNYQMLLKRIASWLADDGKLFVHVFCHRTLTYEFQVGEPGDWMARHFFTGGLMPSADLLTRFQNDLRVERQWEVNGEHYAKTCEACLHNLDSQATEIQELFGRELGSTEALVRVQRWRMFFMACAELFSFGRGDQWFVSHYLFGLPGA